MSVVELKNITKFFPGVKALDDVSFKMHGGKVTAFLGENGAGKSTLLKIINGDYYQTHGTYLIDDEVKHFKNPKEAIDAGISMIYQERQVLPELSVAENVFLGNLPTRNGFVDRQVMIGKTQEIIDDFELDINPQEQVGNLSVAYQQMVEIMKAYNRKSILIAFDEPTASLSDHEIMVLFRIIEKLKKEGKIIAYVTHRMSELDIIADDIVVFKDGRLVGVVEKGKVTPEELIKMMVGRDLGDAFNNLRRNKNIGNETLRVEDLTNIFSSDVSFTLNRGEVLGISGLVGAGRTELIRSVIGADPKFTGDVYLNGKLVHLRSVRDSLDAGIVLVSEDRKNQGIIPNLSVGKNITVSMLKQLTSILQIIDQNKEQDVSNKSIDQFNIKTPDQNKLISELSGGNQQKALLARAYNLNPSVFILDEPTKGIDVGAKFEIYQMIYNLTDRGISVIVISSELPEVIGISDRILVMKDGQITAEVFKEDATEELLLNKAMLDS